MPVEVIVAIVIVVLLLGVVLVTRRSSGPADLPDAALPVVGAGDSLRQRLDKTRRALGDRLNSLLRRGDLDNAFWSELEESLIAADMGVAASTRVTDGVKSRRPETGEEAANTMACRMLEAIEGLAIPHSGSVVCVRSCWHFSGTKTGRSTRPAPRR